MIRLTRLNGEAFYLNVDMVERAEAHSGGTAIFTTGGNVYTVREPVEDIADAVRSEKAAISRRARAEGSHPNFHVVRGEGGE